MQPNLSVQKTPRMNISKEQIDELNAVLTVNIEKKDYSDRVEKILKDHRKNANIPGFRKGHVPMGMVVKQYGQAVLVEEINKIIQESLNGFEKVKKFKLLEEQFTIKANEITPTLKLKRKVIIEKYQHFIDELYNKRKKTDDTSLDKEDINKEK